MRYFDGLRIVRYTAANAPAPTAPAIVAARKRDTSWPCNRRRIASMFAFAFM
jgi:hypothetical protein